MIFETFLRSVFLPVYQFIVAGGGRGEGDGGDRICAHEYKTYIVYLLSARHCVK